MAAPEVVYENDARIAQLTLNRPERLNAIDGGMPVAIPEHPDELPLGKG